LGIFINSVPGASWLRKEKLWHSTNTGNSSRNRQIKRSTPRITPALLLRIREFTGAPHVAMKLLLLVGMFYLLKIIASTHLCKAKFCGNFWCSP